MRMEQLILLFAMICTTVAGVAGADWWRTTHPATCVVGWR